MPSDGDKLSEYSTRFDIWHKLKDIERQRKVFEDANDWNGSERLRLIKQQEWYRRRWRAVARNISGRYQVPEPWAADNVIELKQVAA